MQGWVVLQYNLTKPMTRRRQAGAHGARRRARQGYGRRAALGRAGRWRGSRHTGARSSRGTGAGRAAWARGLASAVHLVHSTCFWPGLTQYCS